MKEINKILFVGSKSRYNSPYQNWYLVLKNLSREIISFDPHWTNICHGREYMNLAFIKTLEKEQPSLVFFLGGLDEFELGTFMEIKKKFPNIKTFIPLSDEDVRFESYSRFMLLFIDYGLVFEKWFLDNFKNDGTPGIYHLEGINTSFFRPIKMEKKYDVCFIGRPLSKKSQRHSFIDYLKRNGIKIALFGPGWEKHKNLKDIYGGPLESGEMVNIINQSKISLCFSRGSDGNLHENYRFFEAGSCNVFVLTEFFKGYSPEFKEGKDIITFRTKEEMLAKIKYFLKNNKKREEIANRAYKKIVNNYSLEKNLGRIIQRTLKDRKDFKKKLPKINKKTIYLSEDDLRLEPQKLKNKLKDFDYVGFKDRFSEKLDYHEYLQQYSLLKSGKPISICDFFVSRPFLENYMYFDSRDAFKRLDQNKFRNFLNKSQIMVTQKFFIKNISLFKQNNFEKKINFGKTNVNFVNFPLLKVKKSPKGDLDSIKNAFRLEFIYFLYAMKHHKNPFRKGHLLGILLESLDGVFFIMNEIWDAWRDKDRRAQLEIYEQT